MFQYSLRVIDEPKMSEIRILNLCTCRFLSIFTDSRLKFVPGPIVAWNIVGLDYHVEDFLKTFLRNYV